MSTRSRSTPRAQRRQERGFATRLLLGQGLVLVAGAATTGLVAFAVGPGIFRDHLARVGVQHTASEARHIEQAFLAALLISLGLALLAAVVAALAVTWYVSRRVQRSLGAIAEAAGLIAAGRYSARVAAPGLGTEFATLAQTYNALARRLENTESTRRRMLSDLAHEMRTPLATVDAHLEAVEDGIRAFDEDTLAVLRESTRRLGRLAEDVGAVSRAEEGNLTLRRQVVDAAVLATAATAAVADRYAGKGVTLESQPGLPPPGPVSVDAERIAQVLGNLLDNALRHTPAGGAVSLTCRRVGRWVDYVVTDTGDGIAAEHLPHLFDRFYRADTARDRGHGGSGIGLAIARALAEAHGGGISATSRGAGRGATFTLRIPT